MRRALVTLGLFLVLLVVVLPLLAGTTDQKQPAQAAPTVGVSVTMADGSSETIPVAKNLSAIIPTPGAKGVFGVQLEPYMSGGNVAVHVRAVRGEAWADAKGPSLQTARIRGTKALGSYLIGGTGDSIQLADLAQFGLASLTLKVVNPNAAKNAPTEDADGCIICGNGLECCWTTIEGEFRCIQACGGGNRVIIKDKLAIKK